MNAHREASRESIELLFPDDGYVESLDAKFRRKE